MSGIKVSSLPLSQSISNSDTVIGTVNGITSRISATALNSTSGLSGTSGTSGTDGRRGTHGTSGRDGEQGPPGDPAGTSGSSGSSGSSGESGTSGSSGITGTSGSSGSSGVSSLYKSTSSTELSITGNGTINLTTESGLSYTVGQTLTVSYNNSNYMIGNVLSYNLNTGSLFISCVYSQGSGTYSLWTINIGSAPGSSGSSGESGTSGISGSSGTSGINGISGGRIYYMNISSNTDPAIDDYYNLGNPSIGGMQVISSPVIEPGVSHNIASFATSSGDPGQGLMYPGIYSFNLHLDANYTSNWEIYVEVYKYSSLDVETLLFTTDPAQIQLDPSLQMVIVDSYFGGCPIDVTDRIVIKIWGSNQDVNNYQFYFKSEGGSTYSFMNTPLPIIQSTSGTSGESGTSGQSGQSGSSGSSGSSGVSGSIITNKISISSQEILDSALGSPKVLIAAPGANKIINIIKAVYVYNFVTTAYVGTTNVVCAYGAGGGATAITSYSILGNTQTVFGRPTITTGGATATSNVVDQPISLYVPGSIATGDSTLDVYITYEILSV